MQSILLVFLALCSRTMHAARAEAKVEARAMSRRRERRSRVGLRQGASGGGRGDAAATAGNTGSNMIDSARGFNRRNVSGGTESKAEAATTPTARQMRAYTTDTAVSDSDGFQTDDTDSSDSEGEGEGRAKRGGGPHGGRAGNGAINDIDSAAFNMLASVSLRSITGSVFDKAHEIALEVGCVACPCAKVQTG